MNVNRREFLRTTVYWGLGAVAVGGASLPVIFGRHRRVAAGEPADLAIVEALVEMVDLEPVYHWVFADPMHGPSLPGPTLVVEEGQPVVLRIANRLGRPHAFAVPGVVDSGPIPPGDERTVRFDAPLGGTYLYLDPLNAPVNRVMGLHGVMIVHPPAFMNSP
ncbi:MAG: multicopper oxidase domain-containing protein, partial [Deferrisomatales bacterium]